MAGIVSYGGYVPYYRLGLDTIGKAWGGKGKGERSVANWDQDTITMAVEATLDCLKGDDRTSVDGLVFASTTSPFKEKQAAAVVAHAADMQSGVFTMDCAGSLRAGTSALRLAIDAVKAGSSKRVVVAASECRLGAPKSGFEQAFGDGAAALLCGDTDVVAELDLAVS